MARLIRILLSSVGGGLILGAGIRMGGKLACRTAGAEDQNGPANEKISPNEEGLRQKLDAQQSEVRQLSQKLERLREHLADSIEAQISSGLAVTELKLQSTFAASQKEALEILTGNLQKRVVDRISRLEQEVATQSTAMLDLRECSLQSERSMQKLLEGIDRLTAFQSQARTTGQQEQRS